jgi:hypothetical protein
VDAANAVLTSIAAAVSSVAYTLTIYDSAWGAHQDYLIAAAAAFLGKGRRRLGEQFISKSVRIGRFEDADVQLRQSRIALGIRRARRYARRSGPAAVARLRGGIAEARRDSTLTSAPIRLARGERLRLS